MLFYFLSLNDIFCISYNSEESKAIWRKEITSYWILFIRLESLLPPPFNLVEDFLHYSKKYLPAKIQSPETKLIQKMMLKWAS